MPNEDIEAHTIKQMRASAMYDFMSCNGLYYYNHINGSKEATDKMDTGSAMHKAIQLTNDIIIKKGLNAVNDKKVIDRVLKKTKKFIAEYPKADFEAASEAFKIAIETLKEFYKGKKIVANEAQRSIKREGITITGTCDIVLYDLQTEEYIILDHKYSRVGREKSALYYQYQQSAYMCIIADNFGTEKVKSYLSKINTTIDIFPIIDNLKQANNVLQQVINAIHEYNKNLVKFSSDWHCRYCKGQPFPQCTGDKYELDLLLPMV